MSSSDDRNSPIAAAMQWVGRIMGAAAIMVLPGLGGQWIDRRLGTSWLALLGFAVGVSLSVYYLVLITKPPKKS